MNWNIKPLIKRVGAYSIDCIIAFAFYAISQLTLFRLIRGWIAPDDAWMRVGLYSEIYTILTISLPIWLYFSLMDASKHSATLGRMVFRQKILTDTTEQRLSFGRSFARTLMKLLPWELAHLANNLPVPMYYAEEPELRITFLFSGGLIVIYLASYFFNAHGRVIYDLIAGTKVVHKQRVISTN